VATIAGSTMAAWTGLRRRLDGWRYPSQETRDSRLDLLRGYMMVVIAINHMGWDSWLYVFTGRDQFVVSGAEGFIFLSGLVMGMVYQGILHKKGLKAALVKLIHRIALLYLLHTALTLAFADASYLLGASWAPPIDDRVAYAAGVLTLEQTYHFTDILYLYMMLVLLAAPALVLAFRGLSLLALLASWVLWGAFQFSPEYWASLTANHGFPVAAWQLFFVTGVVIGYHRRQLWSWMHHLPVRVVLPLLVLFSAVVVEQHLSGGTLIPIEEWTGVDYYQFTNKWQVRPGRLIAAAVLFPTVYLLVTLAWKPLQRVLGWLLLPLGRNSLFAYSAHLFAILLTTVVFPLIPGCDRSDPSINSLVQLTGVMLIWASVQGRYMASRVLQQLWTLRQRQLEAGSLGAKRGDRG